MYGTTYTKGAYQAGEQGIILVPKKLPAAGTKRGVIVAHGYLGDATLAYGTANLATYGGPAVTAASGGPETVGLAIDAGGAATWGNNASITAVGNAWTWLKAQTALGVKTDKVLLIGGSMGALPVLNWARQNLAQVAAIALIIPVLDLQDCHDNAAGRSQNGVNVGATLPNLRTDIEASAGGVGNLTPTYYSTHSPAVFAAQLAGIPIQIWESANDINTNANGITTAAAFAAAAGGTLVNQGVQPGTGHSPGSLTAEQVAAFLATYV